VVLLYGSVPAYRSLSEGMSGADVRQLNRDLVALGYATKSELDPTSDEFGWRTKDALEKLQKHLAVTENGVLGLGQAVFLPSEARITQRLAEVGTPAQPGTVILSASSTHRKVTISLDAAQQSEVKVGDKVIITLPDNTTTPGVVSSVGTVASTPPSDSGGGSPTITVEVTPTHPEATGRLDQAPVLVSITTARVKHALVMPVNALLALATGGYAVEVSSGGTRRLVSVSLGLFDDADGLVQVSGTGLAAGQRVVVPAE
jgi:Putative peptidoglycan binding domain